MRSTPKSATLRLSLALLIVAVGSGCRGMQIRKLEGRIGLLESQIGQLESRIDQLERRASSIEGRMELRVVPVPGVPQPSGD